MIKFFIFSIVKARPDIVFTTFIASYFAKNPSCQYTKAVKIILQYLKSLKKREITYNK